MGVGVSRLEKSLLNIFNKCIVTIVFRLGFLKQIVIGWVGLGFSLPPSSKMHDRDKIESLTVKEEELHLFWEFSK